jgi:transposase
MLVLQTNQVLAGNNSVEQLYSMMERHLAYKIFLRLTKSTELPKILAQAIGK